MDCFNTHGEIRISFPFSMGMISIPRDCVYSIHLNGGKYLATDSYFDIVISTPSLTFKVVKVDNGTDWVNRIIKYIEDNSSSPFINCHVEDFADEIPDGMECFIESNVVIER